MSGTPGLWLLSFAVPMFLNPYSLHVFTEFRPAIWHEAVRIASTCFSRRSSVHGTPSLSNS